MGAIFKIVLIIVGLVFVLPSMIYLCIKYGTMGFLRGKQFINNENKNKE